MAISGDGNTLVAGYWGYGNDSDGFAAVYERTGGSWSWGADLMRPTGSDSFGSSVALSRDGNTLAVGDFQGGGDQNGATRVYVRTGSFGSQGTNLIRPSGAADFGRAIALSANGDTLVIGDNDGGGDANGAVSTYAR